MSLDLHALVLTTQVPDEKITNAFTKVCYVKSLKEAVSALIEKPFDVIVCPKSPKTLDKLKKVSKEYEIPALIAHRSKVGWDDGYHFYFKPEQTTQALKILAQRLENFALRRENKRHQWVTENLQKFNDQVIHTTKDLFIGEAKNFFKNNYHMDTCHWVSVRSKSTKLPPILKLKEELSRQKVNQGTLLGALESCDEEIVSQNNFQIWKKRSGDYMAMLWIHEDIHVSQCIIFNKFYFKDLLEIQSFLSYLTGFLSRRWDLCKKVAQAQELVYRDGLTGLHNQTFLEEVVNKKIEENKRYKTPFSVLFIDVDHFKRVNDSMGHIVGSGVLKLMAGILNQEIRNSDFAFRYGGDEFIILLSHTEGEDAFKVANRIRKSVEKHTFIVDSLEVRITVSIGLACFPQHAQSAADVIRIADEAMYYGKHKGRNIVYKAS